MKKKINLTSASPRGWHRLQLAHECLQKYAYTYEIPKEDRAEAEPTKSPGLIRGSLIHLALAQHYSIMRTLQQGGERDEWSEPEVAVDLVARMNKWDSKFVEEALVTYHDYNKEYPFEREIKLHKIVAVEDLFQHEVKGKYLLTGRIDLAYETQNGQIVIVDHKSTARLTKSHEQYYAMHGQLFGYLYLARKHFGEEKVAGFKVNLIQVSMEPKFQRIDLKRAPIVESTFEQNILDIEERIEHMKSKNRPLDEWPKSINELTCYSRYGPCSFMQRCQYGSHESQWQWEDE